MSNNFSPLFGASSYAYQGSQQILSMNGTFDYTNWIMSMFPNDYKIQPMIGFKMLLTDTQPGINPVAKHDWLESELQRTQLFAGRNCILREGSLADFNSYYLISLPVPRSYLSKQIHENLEYVHAVLSEKACLRRMRNNPYVQINVSGRASMYETNLLMASIDLDGTGFENKIIKSSGLNLVDVVYLSPEYTCIRLNMNIVEPDVYNEMRIVAQLLASAFH